jgi:hypothetical protein
MAIILHADEERAVTGEFRSLAEAEAWLGGLQQAIGSIPRTEFAQVITRLECAYDQFPELVDLFPRHALFRHFRAVAATLPDAQALPLLLLCAAADPSDRAALAGLFERAARSNGGTFLPPAVALFRRYVDLGWQELGPAVAALVEQRSGAAVILATLAEIVQAERPPESVAELGRALASLLANEAPAIDPAALVQAVNAARRHLAAAAAGAGDAAQRRKLLARVEHVKSRLRPPPPSSGAAHAAWPTGEIGFASFMAQWPDLAIEVPAGQLYTRYAALGPDGVLRAERHTGESFCYGPYLNLPAGRYCVRIIGEAAAGAEYSARITHSLADCGPAPVCERRYRQPSRVSGVIAELAFASDIELRGFEAVVNVTSPSAALAVAAITINADRLQPDPDA